MAQKDDFRNRQQSVNKAGNEGSTKEVHSKEDLKKEVPNPEVPGSAPSASASSAANGTAASAPHNTSAPHTASPRPASTHTASPRPASTHTASPRPASTHTASPHAQSASVRPSGKKQPPPTAKRSPQPLDSMAEADAIKKETPLDTPWNIPDRDDGLFLGRTLELERVHHLLQTNIGGTVAIAGMSGVGKTELAMQYATQYRRCYPGGICWINSRSHTLFTQFIQFVQQHVGVTPEQIETTSELDLPQTASAYLSQWKVPGVVLIIFDDVENIAHVEPLLNQLPQRFHSLLTLRSPKDPQHNPAFQPPQRQLPQNQRPQKNLPWQGDYAAAPPSTDTQPLTAKSTPMQPGISIDIQQTLDESIYPEALFNPTSLETASLDIVDLDSLGREESFIWLSTFVGPRVTTAQPAAKTLCKKVSYLPLGISLLGRYLAENASLSVGEVSQSLTQEAQILARQTTHQTSAVPALIDRPSTDLSLIEKGIEATLELCWQQLGAPAQHLARILSFFAPGDVPAALADSVATYTKLVNKDLAKAKHQVCAQGLVQQLTQKNGDVLLRLHPLNQAFLATKRQRHSSRRASGQSRLAQAHSAHDRWEQAYIQGLADFANRINHSLSPQELAQITPAIPYIKTVLEHRMAQVPAQALEALFGGMTRFYSAQAIFTEAHRWAMQSHQALCDRLGSNHPGIAKSLNNLAHVYTLQDRYPEAEALYTQALELSKKQLGEDHPDIANSLNNLANVYSAQNRFGEAEALYIKTLKVTKQSLGEDHLTVATGLNNLALLYANQDRLSEAESLYAEALSNTRRNLGNDHASVAKICNNLANVYVSQGRYEKAEPLYIQDLEITRRNLGENHISVATSLNNLALLYKAQNRFTEAEPLYQHALAITRRTLGEGHPMVAKNLNNLANVYSGQDRFREAEPLYARAIEIAERTLGENHPDVTTSLNNLALLYKTQCRFREAEPLYVKSLKILQRSFNTHPAVLTANLNNLASVYANQGYYKEAEPLYKQALAITERSQDKSSLDVANSLNNLGELYKAQGRLSEAESLCLQALAMNKHSYGDHHPAVSKNLNTLAFLYKEQGRLNEAEDMFAKALEATKQNRSQEHPEVSMQESYLSAFRRSRKRKYFIRIARIIMLVLFLIILIPAVISLIQTVSAQTIAWLLFVLFLGLTVWVLQALLLK
ncbi:MAG: tetratricopeptide repeat protein [Cyanobacteria bacterium J06649_5]